MTSRGEQDDDRVQTGERMAARSQGLIIKQLGRERREGRG